MNAYIKDLQLNKPTFESPASIITAVADNLDLIQEYSGILKAAILALEQGSVTQEEYNQFVANLGANMIKYSNSNFPEDDTVKKALDSLYENKANKQLLDNANWSYKSNIVNQNGQNTYSGEKYTIDRWRTINNGTVTLDGIGITLTALTASFQFAQYIENFGALNGKTLTLSADVGGTVYSGSATVNANADSTPISVALGSSGYNLQLRIIPSTSQYTVRVIGNAGTITIRKVQLEFGNVSTLAADPAQDYGVELANCQRYQLKISGTTRFRATSVVSNEIQTFIPTPATLRITPVAVGTIGVHTLGTIEQTGFTFSYVKKENGIAVIASKTGHGLTDAIITISDVLFDANL